MKVRIEVTTPAGKRESVDLTDVPVKEQESLLEWIEEKSSIISYGCRVGSCGTCMVEVLAGEENLEALTPQEQDTLGRMSQSPRCRLACRARLKTDALGTIEIKTTY